ncbi:hypothetical protein BDY24DRAFT_236085 [Mrakia frigida]|uniref:uncharacterized protein n=1 Tax=Mrakia frigida TaxID=29902 RepID=UPI003FCC23B6
MDIDMSLDDISAANKKTAAPKTAPRSNGGPRTSTGSLTGQRNQAPYSRPPPAPTAGGSWQHDMYAGSSSSNKSAGGGAARPSYNAPANPNTPTARIKIEGLHYEIQKAQLQKIFSQCGTIVDGPSIQYDRSGRSLGIAFVTYDSVDAAKWAREKLDGQKANGEPIKITYVTISLPRTTGVAAKPTGPGAGLLGRLGGVVGEVKSSNNNKPTPSGPRAGAQRTPSAPQANNNNPRGPRPARGVGGGAGGARGAERGARPAKKGPADQDSLDKELEAFMKPDEDPTPAVVAPVVGEAAMEE